MKLSQLVAAAVVFLAGSASEAATDNPDVIWRGDFEDGPSSLGGNCRSGQNQWCNAQVIRPGQIQVVADPVFQGRYAARFEVRYGDVYRDYSDSRSLLSAPVTLWEDEGNERWYRWQVLWPEDWVGDYPKWDELNNPSARSGAGSIVEWHHDANGAVETGSAPLYIGAGNTAINMCLVDQATSTCKEKIDLAPLRRGHWHDFVMHAKWSSDPKVGYLEMWIDGQNVLPMHMGANKYPGMRNYLIVGLYRNGHIGDPNLRYPDGRLIYGSDGAPAVAYVDGFIVGKTRESVQPPAPVVVNPPSAETTPTATAAAGTSGGPKVEAGFPGFEGGGCSGSGPQTAWLALPLVGLLALRRRRRTA